MTRHSPLPPTADAQLNLEAGAESCLAAVGAVLGAGQLLRDADFTARGPVTALAGPTALRADADEHLARLRDYNRGALCR